MAKANPGTFQSTKRRLKNFMMAQGLRSEVAFLTLNTIEELCACQRELIVKSDMEIDEKGRYLSIYTNIERSAKEVMEDLGLSATSGIDRGQQPKLSMAHLGNRPPSAQIPKAESEAKAQ